MKMTYRYLLNASWVIGLTASLLAGCNLVKPHEKAAQEKADQAGLNAVAETRFDGTFVAPGTDFSKYKKILVEQLDMNNIDIVQPSGKGNLRETPWALSDADKRFYQTQYTEAVINNLIADGAFTTVLDPAADALTIKARILQIAPLAPKDDIKSRPGIMKVYTEGSGTMTLEIALHDSASGKLLGIITDKRDLGNIWEENNRVTHNQQVRIAFNGWLRKLRSELEGLSK